MKLYITTLILISLFSVTSGQVNFKVIKVNGTIVIKQKNESLQTGTVFSDKEDLLFQNEDATAAVINSQKGRLILTNTNHDLSSAKSNYLPSMYNISSRGIGDITPVSTADLQNLFSLKFVVLDKRKIEISDTNFPMDGNNFFFIRYRYKGEDINKKISFSADTLILDKKEQYTVDGNPIPSPDSPTVKLFYRKGSESMQISQFDLIFPDMNQLASEVKIILDEIKNKPYKEKLGEVNAYINEFYGKIYLPDLISWLEKKFGLKSV
jgi:hypothetical protein